MSELPLVEIRSLEDFQQDPNNANQGTPRGLGMVENSLHQRGAGRSLVATRERVLPIGNHTHEAAINAGFTEAIVVHSDGKRIVIVQRDDLSIDDPATRILAIEDNRSSEVGLAWDPEAIAQTQQMLAEVQSPDSTAQRMLADLVAEAKLQIDKPAGAGGDEFPTEPQEGPTRTQVGDLWAIGEHRLIIADSTDITAIERLMAGQQADMVFTDPPYGVKVVGGSHDPLGPTYQSGESLQNDDLDEADLETLLRGALGSAWAVCKSGAAWYVTAPAGPLHLVFGVVLRELDVWRQTLTWVKQQFVFGRSDYHYRHEPMFYGWKQGAAHYFTNDHTQDSVWEIDRPMRSDKAHPTVKPLGLVERAVGNSSRRGEIVLDVFGGAGTTLIASYRLGRVCRMAEIDPLFGDVILCRAEAEGISPIERISS